MKIKLKPCAGDDCNGALRPIWKRDDQGRGFCKYCWQKSKPAALKPTRKPLPSSRKPITKQSPRRKKLDVAYSILRKDYLDKHPNCELRCCEECTGISTDIHHLFWAGDREQYMNDFTEVKSGCRPCHKFVHEKMSAEEAREKGFKK